MLRLLRSLVGLTALSLACACVIYTGDDPHGDPPIADPPITDPPAPCSADDRDIQAEQRRDPASGTCKDIITETSPCEPQPTGPVPDWALCDSGCESLDETSCLTTPTCRAIYEDPCPLCDTDVPPTFTACWGIAPSGPIPWETCDGLDAQQCSSSPECAAVHRTVIPADGGDSEGDFPFEYCIAEPAPTLACADLGEDACIGRDDCQPLYKGEDCTCDASGCDCAGWSFSGCRDAIPGFACGELTCAQDHYCQVDHPGPVGEPSYTCVPIPPACDGADPIPLCLCLESEVGCGGTCETDAAGHATHQCYYP